MSSLIDNAVVPGGGTQGSQGPQGNQGPAGGVQGGQGPQGVQGPRGFTGATGPQGFQGSNGITGPQGDQGFQGPQGDRGFQGFQGDRGFQGLQGSQGDQGNQGPTGPQGTQGDRGFQGFQGDQGPQGLGPQGPQGSQGDMGVTGPQGPQGSKLAIVATSDGFRGLVCMEAPEARFEDVINLKITAAFKSWIDDIFVSTCEHGSILIKSFSSPEFGLGHSYFKLKAEGNRLGIEFFSDEKVADYILSNGAIEVNLTVSGIRLGHSDRFTKFSAEQAQKNNKFWSQALG